MENKEISINELIYDFVNTINVSYARINENFRIPNIMTSWQYKLNELKNCYRRANLDINETVTGSIIFEHVNNILINAINTLIDFSNKTKVNMPDSDIKEYCQRKKYLKNKAMLDKYIGYEEAIKDLNIDELKDYIMLYFISFESEEYPENEVIGLITDINEELNALGITDTEELNNFIYNLLRGKEHGNPLSRKK
jgi:hypothetical protein